jgi:thiamine-monophosphate kinase
MKEGPEFSVTGTALGEVEGELLSRRGAQDGDLICVAGDIGLFWSAVLARLHEIADIDEALLNELARALTHPTPKVEWGLHLARQRLATACIDASDGLGSAVASLAAASGVAAVLQAEALRPPHVKEIASRAGVNPTTLGLAWGDWQLVFTVSPSKVAWLKESEVPGQVTVIGHIEGGRHGVFASEEGCEPREIHIRGDQRFAEASYFTDGLRGYVEVLRSSPYTDDTGR